MAATIEDALNSPWILSPNHFNVIQSMHVVVIPAASVAGMPSPGYYISLTDTYDVGRKIIRHIADVKKYNSSAEFITAEGWENGSPYGDRESTLELVRAYPYAFVLTHIEDV